MKRRSKVHNLDLSTAIYLLLNREFPDYVKRFASKDAADEAGEDSESDDEMSSVGSYASGEDENPAGNMDEL